MPSKGWHSRGYLPHFDSQEIVQFVTFRLAGSLPREALERIRLSDRPESLRDELLDRGWGDCWLRLPEIAAIIEQSFLAFDGDRYRLHAWTIMPNHVHVLFGVRNQQLERSGPFWQDDYWDRFIRNDAHFESAIGYIDNNPVRSCPSKWCS
jgi:hypothetical protein